VRAGLNTALEVLVLAIPQPDLKPPPVDERLKLVLAHKCQWGRPTTWTALMCEFWKVHEADDLAAGEATDSVVRIVQADDAFKLPLSMILARTLH